MSVSIRHPRRCPRMPENARFGVTVSTARAIETDDSPKFPGIPHLAQSSQLRPQLKTGACPGMSQNVPFRRIVSTARAIETGASGFVSHLAVVRQSVHAGAHPQHLCRDLCGALFRRRGAMGAQHRARRPVSFRRPRSWAARSFHRRDGCRELDRCAVHRSITIDSPAAVQSRAARELQHAFLRRKPLDAAWILVATRSLRMGKCCRDQHLGCGPILVHRADHRHPRGGVVTTAVAQARGRALARRGTMHELRI